MKQIKTAALPTKPGLKTFAIHADDTRARLLKAAVDVFAEQGYEAATIRQICSRADVNLALVNYHFGDKLELYTEVLRFAMSCAPQPAPGPGLPTGISAEDALRAIIRAMVERVLGNDDESNLRYRLMLHEFVRPTSVTALVVNEVMRPVYDRLREIVGSLLGLPSDHATSRLCTHGVLGQVGHYTRRNPILATLWPEMTMTAEQRELVARHIAESTLAYLGLIRPRSTVAPLMPEDPV
ncbi:MAG: CerR family C-terminal domain-containing protein [Acidobacteriota bacterium]